MRAIGMEDGKKIASFFNISFPLWLRQSHVLHAPRYCQHIVVIVIIILAITLLQDVPCDVQHAAALPQ